MDDVQDTVDTPTAAGRMGITPEAVRKRIARGTLPATKQDGRWYVVLDAFRVLEERLTRGSPGLPRCSDLTNATRN